MTKKANRFEDWITAEKAAHLLSEKLGYPVPSRYIRKLATRKKEPVRTQSLGYHQLYHRDDVLASKVTQRSTSRSR